MDCVLRADNDNTLSGSADLKSGTLEIWVPRPKRLFQGVSASEDVNK